jgi:hypothetical protein
MIENFGNIGDFIGGIGVFVTLIYLAIQIRQNTRSLRLSSIQQVMGSSVSNIGEASTGPIPKILAKLEMGEQLAPEEYAQYMMYLWTMSTHHWQVYYQFQNGMIDANVFGAYVARIKITFNNSLSRALWQTRLKHSFPSDFQNFVGGHIEGDT